MRHGTAYYHVVVLQSKAEHQEDESCIALLPSCTCTTIVSNTRRAAGRFSCGIRAVCYSFDLGWCCLNKWPSPLLQRTHIETDLFNKHPQRQLCGLSDAGVAAAARLVAQARVIAQ